MAGSPLLLGQPARDIIADPKEALNVLDFEAAARKALPPGHFGYLATGVDDDATLRANREGYSRLYLRPRRLVDITKVDMRTKLFGTVWDTPIGLAPVGNQKAFHPEGELPVARAAKEKRALQILSTATNTVGRGYLLARWKTALVSALSNLPVGSDRAPRASRRSGRLPSPGIDNRHTSGAPHRDAGALEAARQTRMRGVPRDQA